MLDINKLPHLDPSTKMAENTEESDTFEESIGTQILHTFSGKKGVALALGIAFLMYISVCFQGERALRNGVYGVLKEIGANGFGVSYKAPSSYLALKSGLYLDDLVITAPEYLGGWQLKAGRISVTANPFRPRFITIEMNGTHSLKTTAIGDIRLLLGKGEITLHIPNKKEVFSAKTVFENIQAAAPKSMAGFFISSLTSDISAESATSYDFSFKTENAHLPAYLSQNLPPVLEYLSFTGNATGFTPSSARNKPLLTDWTDNSGLIEITQGEIIWKPFMTQVKGTFGFNSEMDLIGASTAKVYGFFDILDKFEKAGYIRPSQVSVTKVVLGEKLKVEAGETTASITSPFSFQAGKIYAGQVLLYDSKTDIQK